MTVEDEACLADSHFCISDLKVHVIAMAISEVDKGHHQEKKSIVAESPKDRTGEAELSKDTSAQLRVSSLLNLTGQC